MTRAHLPEDRRDAPMALAALHHAVAPGDRVSVTGGAGDLAHVRDLLTGAGFDEVEIDPGPGTGADRLRASARRARALPDTVGSDMRLLVCGLNPSEYAADAGVGFARPGNRFWPAALEAGLVEVDRDPRQALLQHGVGMTDLVKRATPRAADLTAEEYASGVARVERLVAWLHPRAVCFVGLAGWRSAIDRLAVEGPQGEPFGGRPVYLMGSTSGLNAHARPADCVEHLRRAAALADRS